MKKSLIALAVAAALPAFAQAQTNVQLYGIMDVGVGYKDLGGKTDGAIVLDSGFQSTSRFGVRGSEALGGGLSATFNLEMGIGADQGTAPDTIRSDNRNASVSNGLFQRRSVVGMQGSWGEVNLGRDYTPGFSAAGQTDVMGYSFFGNWLNFTAGATQGTTDSGLGIQTRASNGIHYKSPAFGNTKCMAAPAPDCGAFSGGLSFALMYATGENIDGNNAGDAYGGAAVYKGGPLVAQGYWQRSIAPTPTSLSAVSGDIDVDQYGLGAGWNFGMFRVAGNWGEAKYAKGPYDAKLKGWGIGVALKLGPGELLANYINRNIDASSNLGVGDPKADTYGIAYTYPMSARTNMYATWGMTSNNSDGKFNLGYSQAGYSPTDLGADVSGFAVGIRHQF